MTSAVPAASASGRLRVGFRTSAAAKVTLFHASLLKREPTMAAPTSGTSARVHGAEPQKLPKLVATTSGCRNTKSPSRMSAASAPTFAKVSVV